MVDRSRLPAYRASGRTECRRSPVASPWASSRRCTVKFSSKANTPRQSAATSPCQPWPTVALAAGTVSRAPSP